MAPRHGNVRAAGRSWGSRGFASLRPAMPAGARRSELLRFRYAHAQPVPEDRRTSGPYRSKSAATPMPPLTQRVAIP